MPKIQYVKAARASKEERICESCQGSIQVGQGFAYWSVRYGPTRRRHHPACPNGKSFKSWRLSETTSSDKLARLYEQQEILQDLRDTWEGDDAEELHDALDAAAEVAREVAEEYSEADEAMGGHGGENADRADECEAWADDLERAAQELEPFEATTTTTAEDRSDWKENMLDIVESVAGSLGL